MGPDLGAVSLDGAARDNRGGARHHRRGDRRWHRPVPTEEGAQWMGEGSSGLVHDHHHGELGLAVALPLPIIIDTAHEIGVTTVV